MISGISELIKEPVLRYPNSAAVIWNDRKTTFAKLDERVNRLANALHAMGVSQGDCVALLSKNSGEFREVYLAAIKSGLTLLPLNYRLTEDEMAYIVADGKPSIIMAQEEYADLASRVAARGELPHKLICLGRARHNMPAYEDIVANGEPKEPITDLGDDALAVLMYTSGTTGRPKGAMMSRGNLAGYVHRSALTFPLIDDKVRVLAVMPMHASAGYMYDLRYHCFGAISVILPAFDPLAVMRAVQDYRITDVFLVPTAINLLINHPDFAKYDMSSLKEFSYTGSPMPLELLNRCMRIFGDKFWQVYGSTESIGIAFLAKDDHVPGSRRITSAGKAQPGVLVKILDDAGLPRPTGEMGEVCVKSDTVMLGYYGKLEATAECIKDGWFHTGDVGFMDEDGYIYIRDRKKDMIISGGHKLYPAEIENALMAHPGVLEVAVIGVPDVLWGESPMAVIVKKEGVSITEEEIVEFCKSKLASYKKPKAVAFVASLPKTSTGKVQRWSLRNDFGGR